MPARDVLTHLGLLGPNSAKVKILGIVSVDDLMCKTISEESCRSLLRCMGSVQADIPDWHYQTHIIILTELGGWPFFDHTHTCLEHCSFKKVGKCQRSNQVQDWNELYSPLLCVTKYGSGCTSPKIAFLQYWTDLLTLWIFKTKENKNHQKICFKKLSSNFKDQSKFKMYLKSNNTLMRWWTF